MIKIEGVYEEWGYSWYNIIVVGFILKVIDYVKEFEDDNLFYFVKNVISIKIIDLVCLVWVCGIIFWFNLVEGLCFLFLWFV